MTTVVYYDSEEAGAPTLNNANGSMINVLDACLVNGFNAKSVTSIVVAGGVATATISAHGYTDGRIVEFDGSVVTGGTSGALNGRKKIARVDANTVTFPATGVADQAATGTITAKRPGLGWTKAFSGTNKAIYGRSDPMATTMQLRIDDTGSGVASATQARALMVEGATTVDDYTHFTPHPSQISGGQYWSKGPNNSTAKPWVLVGDGRTMYFWTDHDSYNFGSYSALHMRAFGDLKSYRAADAYSCLMIGDYGANAESQAPFGFQAGTNTSVPSFSIARLANGIDAYPYGCFTTLIHTNQIGATGPVYPSPVDNGLVLSHIQVAEHNGSFNHPVRGAARGLLAPIANVGSRLNKRIQTGLMGFDGDVLFVATMTQGLVGCLALDITGPWG